jgi:hypothetical protein
MGSTLLGDQRLPDQRDALGRIRRPAEPDGEVRPGDRTEDAGDAPSVATGGVGDDRPLGRKPLPERPRDQLAGRTNGVHNANGPVARFRAKSLASQVV